MRLTVIQDRISFQYEELRLKRYDTSCKFTVYTQEEYLKAYSDWADHPFAREHFWDKYCDMRDNVPYGTNAKIRRNRGDSRFN